MEPDFEPGYVHRHLLAQAEENRRRDEAPITARDVLLAKQIQQLCLRIAKEIEGLGDDAALAHLKRYRTAATGLDPREAGRWLMSMQYAGELDELIDPIARENCGWIEVSEYGSNLMPYYRRMLGINHCVAALRKEPTEGDDDWLARRAAWLGRYNPAIPVKFQRERWTPQGMVPAPIGTVAEFAAMRHTVEAGLGTLRGFKLDGGIEYRLERYFLEPQDGVLGEVRQVAGAPQPEGVIDLRRYKVRALPAEIQPEQPAHPDVRERQRA